MHTICMCIQDACEQTVSEWWWSACSDGQHSTCGPPGFAALAGLLHETRGDVLIIVVNEVEDGGFVDERRLGEVKGAALKACDACAQGEVETLNV